MQASILDDEGLGPGAGAGPSPPQELAPARDVGLAEGQGGLMG